MCVLFKWLLILGGCFFINLANARIITIGTTIDNPPFASAADTDGHFYGFEIDIMMAICKELPDTCVFNGIVVSNVKQLLDSNKIDLVLTAIIAPPINSPEVENYIFSNPYLPSYAQFIVKNGSKIRDLEALRNKTVGVRLGALFGGTLFKDFILGVYNNELKVKLYLSMNELLAALQDGRVDAVFSNAEPLRYWSLNMKDVFHLVGKRFQIGNGYVVMGLKSEADLITRINAALAKIQQDGTYVRIYDRYFTL